MKKGYSIVINNAVCLTNVSNQGKKAEILPHRPNELPHRSLVLCSKLSNDHGHFDEVWLEFKTKFRKKGSTIAQQKS